MIKGSRRLGFWQMSAPQIVTRYLGKDISGGSQKSKLGGTMHASNAAVVSVAPRHSARARVFATSHREKGAAGFFFFSRAHMGNLKHVRLKRLGTAGEKSSQRYVPEKFSQAQRRVTARAEMTNGRPARVRVCVCADWPRQW